MVQSFGDGELNRLETLALTNNQNLAATVARFEQARSLATGARADFYPQITLGGTPGGDITRQRTSRNQPNQGNANGASHTFDTFTARFTWAGRWIFGACAAAIRSGTRTFRRQCG